MTRSMLSPSPTSNAALIEQAAKANETNLAWLARLGAPGGVRLDENGIILLGGSSLASFRIRVAQSVMRRDLFPSYWSHCGILRKGGLFATVPLGFGRDISAVPPRNGVEMSKLADYDDPKRYPNVAVIRFAQRHDDVHRHIDRLQNDRSLVDLPAMMLRWLGFVWGSGAPNPLIDGVGLPSAAFVETVFSMVGADLTPGLSSRSSCPEAIWQAAKWWRKFYESDTAINPPVPAEGQYQAMTPEGFYVVRQPAAAIVE